MVDDAVKSKFDIVIIHRNNIYYKTYISFAITPTDRNNFSFAPIVKYEV